MRKRSPVKHDGQGKSLLEVHDLSVCFDATPVFQHVCFEISPQQIVAIVGPNGSGKTTILKTIGGLIKPARGRLLFDGEPIGSLGVWEIVRRGIVYVPEGMSVFRDMTVIENLEIGGYLNRKVIPERLKAVFELFPELLEKKQALAGVLSGGQQRMVTLARGLMAGARLLLLDDPFLGLSPKIVKRFCDTFRVLRHNGVTLFIAGQHVRRILNVADVAFLIEDGAITLTGPGPEVLNNTHLKQILFGSDTVTQHIVRELV
jgi:branched-chain amino acid transport system ATP-binding protein